MKSRNEIISLLRRYKPTAQEKYGISKLGIFMLSEERNGSKQMLLRIWNES